MKIILISDESWLGGASITNESIINAGKEKGYDMGIYAYGMNERNQNKEFNPPKADYYILANYGYIPPHDLITFATDNKGKYFRFFHDIPGFISALPSSFFAESESVLSLLLLNAAKIFMISPMQHGIVNQRINLKELEDKISIIPPYIPLNDFSDLKKERVKDSWLYLGDINEARGVSKSISVAIANKAKTFVLAGPEVSKEYIDNLSKAFGEKIDITYLGIIEYKDVNEIMNRYENFIYTPEIYDSFCRKVVEAKKAGMKVFVDDKRIGVYSFPEEYDIEEGVLTANKVLWTVIDEVIKDESNTTTVSGQD